jgi:hypothetical protein
MILFILIGFIAFVVLACGISVIATGLRYPTPPDTPTGADQLSPAWGQATVTSITILKAMQKERVTRALQIVRYKAKREAWRDRAARIRREYRALERAIEALSK